MFSSFLSPKRLSQVAGTNPFLYRSYFCHVAPKIRGIICKRINKNGRRQCSCSYSTRHCSDSARTLRRSPHCSSCHRQAPRRPVSPYNLSQAFYLPGFSIFSIVLVIYTGLAAPYPCWRLRRRLFARKAGAKERARRRRGIAQIQRARSAERRKVPAATDKRIICLAVIKP